jgi:hypothetical protein
MSMKEHERLAEIVEQFLQQWCVDGAELRCTEIALFAKFRLFWAQATNRWIHEASFSDFHAEMQRRGYRSVRTSRRYWYGLKLRKKPGGFPPQ